MIKIKKIYSLFFLSFCIIVYTGCNSSSSNEDDIDAKKSKSEINAELLQEQNDLYEKVCEDFTEINKKVIELNDKIHSMEGKLTEAQNSAIDEIEEKRASVNTRMRGLKKVSSADWENFKTTLEKDIVDVKAQIDEIISTIN
jgi:predicted  nucleic acid-binding Zn-ribbon protein